MASCCSVGCSIWDFMGGPFPGISEVAASVLIRWLQLSSGYFSIFLGGGRATCVQRENEPLFFCCRLRCQAECFDHCRVGGGVAVFLGDRSEVVLIVPHGPAEVMLFEHGSHV